MTSIHQYRPYLNDRKIISQILSKVDFLIRWDPLANKQSLFVKGVLKAILHLFFLNFGSLFEYQHRNNKVKFSIVGLCHFSFFSFFTFFFLAFFVKYFGHHLQIILWINQLLVKLHYQVLRKIHHHHLHYY